MIFTASNNIAYKLRFPAGIPAITKSKCLNQQGAHAFSNVRFIYSWLSSCLPNCNWVVGLPTHRRQVEISFNERYRQLIMIASYPQSARCTIVGQLNLARPFAPESLAGGFINIPSSLNIWKRLWQIGEYIITHKKSHMQSILAKADIKLDWNLAYIGLENHWLSASDVMEDIDSEKLQALSIEEIAELYVKVEDSREALLAHLSGLLDADKKVSLRVWAYAFLRAVLKSDDSPRGKLTEVASLWAMFNYDERWSDFIYYLPARNEKELGEDFLYKKLETFLQEEAEALNFK